MSVRRLWITALVGSLALAGLAAPVRAQDEYGGTGPAAEDESTAPTASSGEPAAEGIAGAPSVEGEVPETEGPLPDPTAPAIRDGRLVDVNDGIEDLFAAWVSERVFSGPIFSGGASAGNMLVLSTSLGVRYGIGRDARVSADWGFAFSSSQVQGFYRPTTTEMIPFDLPVDQIEAQNPVLAFSWGSRIGATRFSFGLGAAAPTAAGEQIPGDVTGAAHSLAADITHELMLAMNGGLTPWRYRAERFGLFLPISFQFPIDQMTIAIEGAAAIAAPVIGAGRNRPVTGDLTADLQLSGDVIPELRLGARFAIAVLGIGENLAPGTIVQPSVAASARLRLDPVFLVGELLVDLGGYYGLSGNGGVWSVTLGGGAAIP